MKTEEQAAFYKTLVRRGISIFPAPENMQENGLAVVVSKILTTLDNRVYVDGGNKGKGFATEDEAIDFAKKFIDWNFETTEEVSTEVETSNCYFEAHMMINLGFGPQNVSLGQLVSSCQSDDWYQKLQEDAKKLAKDYLIKNYPERNPDQISKSVKVLPVR